MSRSATLFSSWRGINESRSSCRASAACQALDSAEGAGLTSASMKHSHSVCGSVACTPTAHACVLPVQRGGSGGLPISTICGCDRASPSTIAAVASAE